MLIPTAPTLIDCRHLARSLMHATGLEAPSVLTCVYLDEPFPVSAVPLCHTLCRWGAATELGRIPARSSHVSQPEHEWRQSKLDRAAGSRLSRYGQAGGTISPVRIPRAIIHIALHNVMPESEVVLRYEQILHTLQTAVDDGEKKYTAELNATMEQGIEIRWRPYQDHLCGLHAGALQVSISVALAATVEPLVGGIMLTSGLTSFLVTRTQLRSQDGVR